MGAINTPVGYNLTDSGLTSFPYTAVVDGQVRTICCCLCLRHTSSGLPARTSTMLLWQKAGALQLALECDCWV